jgi:hypothetical protein
MPDGSPFVQAQAPALPEQDWGWITRHAERFQAASEKQAAWARVAKACVDALEGRQWSAADLAKLESEGRPALVINKILPLFRLVVGYFANNRTDIKYLPGNDGSGTSDIARVLSHVSKHISELNQLPYSQAEVFMDGIVTGRGYWDIRLGFERNLLGDCRWAPLDPFSVYVDPEASDYDLNTGNYVVTSRWLSTDEIRATYGKKALEAALPMLGTSSPVALPLAPYGAEDEISPRRTFGAEEDGQKGWSYFQNTWNNWFDPYRKTVRMLDIQHYVRTWAWHFVDLRTGDMKRIPDSFGQDKVQRMLAHMKSVGQQVTVVNMQVRRLRWTQMVGHIMVADSWSPYETFTVVPFFPYFRRGATMGFVEPLLDPQREINVRRSARINIIGRSSNGGWQYPEGSLTPQEEQNLKMNGGKPGFTLKYKAFDAKGQPLAAPQQISPAQAPVSIEQLEKEAEGDIKEIAGINDAALGLIDQGTASGRAIRARQQGAVIGLELSMLNWHRTMDLAGAKQLEIIQGHYTEERTVAVTGRDGNQVKMVINQQAAAAIANDVTLGRYSVVTDETTANEQFMAAQFAELMELRGLGLPIPDDHLIDASSIPRKEEVKMALAQARQQMAAQPGLPPEGVSPPAQGSGPGPGGSQVDADGGSLPASPGGGEALSGL